MRWECKMKKESFIDEIVGNIKDTIKNITYSLQRYSDEFVNYMTLSYKSLKEYNFNDDIVCSLRPFIYWIASFTTSCIGRTERLNELISIANIFLFNFFCHLLLRLFPCMIY